MATELSHDLSLAFDTYSKVSQAERKYSRLSVEKKRFLLRGNRSGIRKLSSIFFLMIWCWKKGQKDDFLKVWKSFLLFPNCIVRGNRVSLCMAEKFSRPTCVLYVRIFLSRFGFMIRASHMGLTWKHIPKKIPPKNLIRCSPLFLMSAHLNFPYLERNISVHVFFFGWESRVGDFSLFLVERWPFSQRRRGKKIFLALLRNRYGRWGGTVSPYTASQQVAGSGKRERKM